MERTAGLLRTVGVKTGEIMAQRKYLFYFRCILVNQEELGLERFTLAIALNNEQIEENVEEFSIGGEGEEAEPEMR